MSRGKAQIVGAILGVVCAAVALFVLNQNTGPRASGEVGWLYAFGQTAQGPVKLKPQELRILKRPQDIAFQFSCTGTGPRVIRIEIHTEHKNTVMHEEVIEAPKTEHSLAYVLKLDARIPARVDVVVTIETPHTMNSTTKLPLLLKDPPQPGKTGTTTSNQ